MLDVVHDGDLGVAGENEVAVHAVDGKVRWDGSLSGSEALRDDGTAVDTAGSWGMPERSGVGKDVLGGVRGSGKSRERGLTGPMIDSSVSSRTFSMADLERSRAGGLTSVDRSAIVNVEERRRGVRRRGGIAREQ